MVKLCAFCLLNNEIYSGSLQIKKHFKKNTLHGSEWLQLERLDTMIMANRNTKERETAEKNPKIKML